MKTNTNVEFRRLLKQLNLKNINPLAFRDLTVSDLGSFVTTGKVMSPRSVERGAGFIYDLVNKVRVSKGILRLPLVDDTAADWFLSSDVGAPVDFFPTAITLAFDQQQTSPIRISNSLISDCTDFDLLEYINKRIEIQYLRHMCEI